MNNRDESVDESISQLLNAFLALEICRRLDGDLACREETSHRAVKVRRKVFLGRETQVTDSDHSMDLCLNGELLLLKHIVDRCHKLIDVSAHVLLQIVREVAHEATGKASCVFI